MSGLRGRKVLVGTGKAISIVFGINGVRNAGFHLLGGGGQGGSFPPKQSSFPPKEEIDYIITS